jgi:hypothetical protein
MNDTFGVTYGQLQSKLSLSADLRRRSMVPTVFMAYIDIAT